MITKEVYDQTALNTLAKVKQLLSQAEQVHPDIPMSVLISLMADASLLNDAPETFEQELLEAIKECRVTRYTMICNEAAQSVHH